MQWIRREKPTGGQIIFDGEDITKLEGAKLQPYHKRMQIIFQDPYASLDPRMTIGRIIGEPIEIAGYSLMAAGLIGGLYKLFTA